ncbi:MAG: thioredoxin [Candidatus Methanofastidiosia archaeon]
MLKASTAPDHPIAATDDNFDKLLEEHPLLLVDFWAEWCMPCKMFAPTLEAFAKDMNGKVTVAKLNVDENRATALKYRTMSIPTAILFKDGQPIDKVIGAVPKETLVQMIKRYE